MAWMFRWRSGGTCCGFSRTLDYNEPRKTPIRCLATSPMWRTESRSLCVPTPTSIAPAHSTSKSKLVNSEPARSYGLPNDLTRAEHSPWASRRSPQILNDQFRPPVDLYAHSSLCIVQGSKSKCRSRRQPPHSRIALVPSLSHVPDRETACLPAWTHMEPPSATAGPNASQWADEKQRHR